MGWLHSAPNVSKDFGDYKTKLSLLDKESEIAQLPNADRFICDCWFKLNLCSSTGYGRAPLSYTEINAFDDCLGLNLSPIEFDLLVRMSTSYVSSINKYDNNNIDYPPYLPSESAKQDFKRFRRKLVNAKLNSM